MEIKNTISESLKVNREKQRSLTINQALDYLFRIKVKDSVKKDLKKSCLIENHINQLQENKVNLGGRTFLDFTTTLLIIETIMFCENINDNCIVKK